jgi:hypothetical protein
MYLLQEPCQSGNLTVNRTKNRILSRHKQQSKGRTDYFLFGLLASRDGALRGYGEASGVSLDVIPLGISVVLECAVVFDAVG